MRETDTVAVPASDTAAQREPHAATAADALVPVSDTRRRPHAYIDVAVVIVVLTCTNLIAHFTTAWANIVSVPVAAVILLALVRRRGLGWAELGLSPRHWRRGSLYALAAVGLVLTVVAVGALLPVTRPFFLADRYATISGALIASMIVIPLQTVIPEELAFRGVLHGTLDRAWGARGVFAAGSLLFGLWHIASSFGLTSGNKGLSAMLPGGVLGQIAGIALAVLATAAAGVVFTWLRRRSGSLLAPIALHWSVNGLGALTAALVWHTSLA
ncbi:MAG TPA: CPBP family intramembrane glutamic endopeptidase [Nocardia sp.]|uniref:CPBP family intramembrane glutamic endopeptidase n=1 Tax=Nocardia TaxID=1817 RepID=UPI002458CA72|nr:MULTISPECIES: CPBP family intramembrane metalloprotease [Nocardia]HLS78079.1 CPBP family intramembrane glutamic endopeptidase [Nocardia sp.]